MLLQCVTVSVKYSDFLCHVLEENKGIFDKWVIVTDTKDTQTKELCEKYSKYNVICIQTDIFYKKARFNKFAGINEALKLIDEDAWVVFLDSDMVLQPVTRRVLNNLDLDKTCIYGIDRVNCKGRENWEMYKGMRNLVHNHWLMNAQNSCFEYGARLVHYYGYEGGKGEFAGWNPIGFFQMAHRSAFTQYPQNSEGADHCDLVFARLWPRSKRVLIPELIGIHLESHFIINGVNWYGRLSQPFELGYKKYSLKYFYRLVLRKFLIHKKTFFRRYLHL